MHIQKSIVPLYLHVFGIQLACFNLRPSYVSLANPFDYYKLPLLAMVDVYVVRKVWIRTVPGLSCAKFGSGQFEDCPAQSIVTLSSYCIVRK